MNESQSAASTASSVPLAASLTLVVLCLIWGGNTVSIKISNQGIPPLLAATARSAVASTLLWAYARTRKEGVFLRGGDLRHGAVIGVLFGLEFVFIYWGLAFTDVSRGIVFLYAHPFWVALGAHFFLPGDRLTATKVVGLLMAFVGLVVVFGSRSATLGARFWIGDLMILTAGILWGATTLYIKRVVSVRGFTHYQTMFAQLFFSIPVIGVAWVLFQRGQPVSLTPPVVGAFAYQCVVVAFFSYVLWFWMIHRFPVSRLHAFTFFTPLFAVLLSGIILREDITPLLWLGLSLVGIGIYLVNRPAKVSQQG